MFVVVGFFTDIHNSNCAIPGLFISNDSCPSSCDCFRSYEKCQISACDDLDYWHWWGIRYFKWR